MAFEADQQFQRPKPGIRFELGGMKTNAVPDALPLNKYPYLENIRATRDNSIRTRWGKTRLFPTANGGPIDMRTYVTLGTDAKPRVLAAVLRTRVFGAVMDVYLGQPGDTSTLVGTLAGVGTGFGPFGAAMLPFRPAESPSPWMYVANGFDYQKFSAPGAGDAVTMQKVGIAEPQVAVDAAVFTPNLFAFSANPSYANAGVAGAVSNTTRVTDTVQSVFADPAVANGAPTIGVSSGQVYTRNMMITVNGAARMVLDVYPGQTTAIGIASIRYYSGTTGRCVIVPEGMGAGPGNVGQSIYVQNLLNTVRRGALIKFSSGPETCYVWSVTLGPDGTICIETSTTNNHTNAETVTFPPAVQLNFNNTVPVNGQAISSATATSAMSGAGIGTLTSTVGIGSPFVSNNFSYQSDDYIQFAVNVSTLANLTEMKILFDVGDGSFTQNFYYYTVRVSDIEAGVQNTLTQLGAAQLLTQRATIDEEHAAATNNQLSSASGAQTTPGDSQWAQIVFPISELTRVGNDQTRTLQNVGKIQFLFNVTGTATIAVGVTTVLGGNSPDVGLDGAPYRYRVRPRSSLTGVKGNPSPDMRYGVNPLRTPVNLALPSAAYDSQIDTWDIFRYGGSVTSWRKIGQAPSTATTFTDVYGDEAALAGEELEFDNLEPWPSIDIPLNATATSVTGYLATVSIPGVTNVLGYLPGNLVRLGGTNVYTLRTRPTQVPATTNYIFEFIENAGTQSNVPCQIYEPSLARQFLPYMWGPDAQGTVFAVGDDLRPGTIYFAKNYDPDSAPDRYNQEICDPSEPLLGGEVLDGLSWVASPDRWWALYPQPDNPAQRYSAVQQPVPRGLAAPYAHATDGRTIYFWAKDGIWSTVDGSLTDADLSNLFPRDGVPGSNTTYLGHTVYAPDYSAAATFRLTYGNHYLYALYEDTTGARRTLVYDVKRKAWSVDTAPTATLTPTCYYAPEQPEGSLATTGTSYPLMLVATAGGEVYSETNLHNDDTQPIQCVVCTAEWDGGDARAGEQWGDLWLDSIPAAFGNSLTATPTAFGALLPGVTSTTIPTATSRTQSPVSVGGDFISDFLGLSLSWGDDYSQQTVATSLQIWQPSFLPKPETIIDRATDWYDGDTEKAKWMQGFLLHADTGNVAKGMVVRDADTQQTHPFTPFVVHNGESILAYSFVTPFIAHMVRLEPSADGIPWRFFDVDWVFEPTPEMAESWQTQGTSFGFNGYSHIQRIVAAYSSTAPIVLTIQVDDGTPPAPITLPASGGVYQKSLQVLTANKGQLFFFSAVSAQPFQFYVDDFEIQVGNWGRSGGYVNYRSLGGRRGDAATI